MEDPTKGSITPRIPRLVWIIDEENDQNWNGGYYWPLLPKMTKGGVFTQEIDLEQYGDGIIVMIILLMRLYLILFLIQMK